VANPALGPKLTPEKRLCPRLGSRNIYKEKVTGAHEDRRELLKMLKALVPGDVVTVTRIDRLARSTFDLFAIVKQIVGAKAQFRSLAEPGADTGTSTGRLMLAVLGGLLGQTIPPNRPAEELTNRPKYLCIHHQFVESTMPKVSSILRDATIDKYLMLSKEGASVKFEFTLLYRDLLPRLSRR
jgi:hypothetical protein